MPPSVPSSSQLLIHRQQFPALQHKTYFNYGGQGPMAAGAMAALQEAQVTWQQQGPFSQGVNQWLNGLGVEVRQALADRLGIAAATLTLTESVTAGCNIALWGLDWRGGDRILLSDCEHPGIVATVQEIQRRFGVGVDYFPLLATAQGGDPVGAIAAALQPRTRLLVISHGVWNTGQVLPLAAIVALCHDRPEPILVLVDGAQTVGMMPLDLAATGVDFYAFTGHKWCCGPAGLGGLYVSPAVGDRLAPTFIGWRGVKQDSQGQPAGWHPDGRRYEVATSDYALMPALTAALAIADEWGTIQQRYHRLCTLSAHLWHRLQTIPQVATLTTSPPPSGLVSFRLLPQGGRSEGERASQFVTTCEGEGILLRTLAHPACVRACVSYLTLEAEIEALGDRIAAAP